MTDRENVARAICKPLGYILGFASDVDPDRVFFTVMHERRSLRDISEELADAALSAMQGDGWRGIESAPKDGTKVFLWLPEINDFQRACRIESFWSNGGWQNKFGNGFAYNVNARPNKDLGGMMAATWEIIQPSHWQPLPAPPSAARIEALSRPVEVSEASFATQLLVWLGGVRDGLLPDTVREVQDAARAMLAARETV